MTLLGIDTSSLAASAAIIEDGAILAENFVNVKRTHSETLFPMVESVLGNCGKSLSSVDLFAVTAGPGSFTGVRIGISAVKGMAMGTGKLCVPVSTLEALAYNLLGRRCVAVPVMDARCGQVYTALFQVNGRTVSRLSEDMAIPIDELRREIAKLSLETEIVLLGDGAKTCFEIFNDPRVTLAPEHLRFQRAASVCLAALSRGETPLTPSQLVPFYLRPPQAQRERIKRESNKVSTSNQKG